MKNFRQMYQKGITLQDLPVLIEYGIKFGSITAEIAILSVGYVLAVQAGLSPISAVALEAAAVTAYHHRQGVFQFFAGQWENLKNTHGTNEEDDDDDTFPYNLHIG